MKAEVFRIVSRITLLVNILIWTFSYGQDVKFVRVCQNHYLHLDCDAGEQIVIMRTLFGRTKHWVPECGYQSIYSCVGRQTVHVVAGFCHGHQNCLVYASTGIFGNPCKGIYKYLEAEFRCTPAGSIVDLCGLGPSLNLLPGDKGYISSPKFPKQYGKREHCSLDVETQLGTKIRIAVLHANFPDENTCLQDSLKVEDHAMNQVYTFCNDTETQEIITVGNASVSFSSDGHNDFSTDVGWVAKGFVLEYTVSGCLLGTLIIPEHAQMVTFDGGTSARLECLSGFQFTGGDTVVCSCMNSAWQCPPLECETTRCVSSDIIPPANSWFSMVDDGNRAVFKCEQGHVPTGAVLGELVCDEGQWTGSLNECEETDCDEKDANIPENCRISSSTDGRHLSFKCRYGYRPSSGSLGNLTCSLGVWTGTVGKCEDVNLAAESGESHFHKIAFSSQLSNSFVMISPRHPVPFDIVTLNDGDGYNLESSKFEVPINGTYMFTWSVRGPRDDVMAAIKRDGVIVGGSIVEGEHSSILKSLKLLNNITTNDPVPLNVEDIPIDAKYPSTKWVSSNTLLSLNEGSVVWIEFEGMESTLETVDFLGNQSPLPRATFSGHILYAT